MPATASTESLRAAKGTLICPESLRPFDGAGPIDAVIQDVRPPGDPVSGIWGCFLYVIRKDFLQRPELALLRQAAVLGQLHSDSGERIEAWATIYVDRLLVVRGTEKVAVRTCRTCGRTGYFALGRRYLCPAPPPDVNVFQSATSFVIRGQVPEGLNRKWHSLRVGTLDVVPAPLDGLPVNLLGARERRSSDPKL